MTIQLATELAAEMIQRTPFALEQHENVTLTLPVRHFAARTRTVNDDSPSSD